MEFLSFTDFFVNFIIDSAMFLLTGNAARSQLATLRSDARPSEMNGGLSDGANVSNGHSSNFSKIADAPVKPGEVTAHESLKSLLDCCILYYYAVAHKYIIMVSVSNSFSLRIQFFRN